MCVKVFVEKPQVFDTQQMRIKSVAAEGSNQEMILAVRDDDETVNVMRMNIETGYFRV